MLRKYSKWIMDQMNWTNFKNMHEMSIIKMTHKFINSEDENYYKKYLIENRGIRAQHQNKTGPHIKQFGTKEIEQKTFLYKSKNLYKNIPKELTLMKNSQTFKKWLKKYYKNKNIAIPSKKDEQRTNATYQGLEMEQIENIEKCHKIDINTENVYEYKIYD